MSLRASTILVAAWLLSLVTVAALAQRVEAPAQSEPEIISGDEIGFRVEGREGNRPVGTLVVRVNGRWVEPTSVPQVRPLGSQ